MDEKRRRDKDRLFDEILRGAVKKLVEMENKKAVKEAEKIIKGE